MVWLATFNDLPVRPMRLLLADDNPAILMNVVNILQPNFVIAGAFTDGGSVLKHCVQLMPDIIILEISMGDLTGFEVTQRLREPGCQARVIFLTVHEDLDSVQAAFFFRHLLRFLSRRSTRI